MTKRNKLTFEFALLASLYVAQGLPYGFFTQALPVLLRKSGMSLPAIGFSHLLTIPWALKFLWAPAVDRLHSHKLGLRKSWLLPLQLASVIVFGLMSFVSPKNNINLILSFFLITNALAAAQDIATDGLAVDLLTEKNRGWGNGIQVAGYRIGMVIGGGALLALFDWLDWRASLLAMAALVFLCTVPVVFFNEPPASQRKDRPQAVTFKTIPREIFHFLLQPGALPWAFILLTFKFGHASATGMLRPWLVDSGYTMSDIAQVLGSAGFVAGFLGAMLGGALSSKFSNQRPRLLIISGLVQMLAVVSYLWPFLTEHESFKVVIATALDHFTSGVATTILFTIMMDACSPSRAASDYTVQASLVVISQLLSQSLSGLSAAQFGYGGHFLISGVCALSAIFAAILLLRLASVRKLLQAT